LPLFEDVVMVEPVDKFVSEAYRSARDGEWRDLPSDPSLEMDQRVGDRGKRIWFIKGGLQGLDPKYPGQSKTAETIGVVGTAKGGDAAEGFNGDGEVTYDV
jgi:protein N-terminal methyltransferase